MICKTDMIQSQCDGTFYLICDFCLAVRRKFRVDMTVCSYSSFIWNGSFSARHTMVPPPSTYSPWYSTSACPGVTALTGVSKWHSSKSSPIRFTLQVSPL